MSGNSKAWQGVPELPFVHHNAYTGEDVLVQLTFLNTSGVPTQPTSLQYEVDSLTVNQNLVPVTIVTTTGPVVIVQLPASLMVNTRNFLGQEARQALFTAVIPDANAASGSITKRCLVIIDLVNIATPSGNA